MKIIVPRRSALGALVICVFVIASDSCSAEATVEQRRYLVSREQPRMRETSTACGTGSSFSGGRSVSAASACYAGDGGKAEERRREGERV